MSLIQFLQSSSGENSSKRLGFIISLIVSSYCIFAFPEQMIAAGKSKEAFKLIASYFIYSAVLGGFVTAELIIKIIELKNGRGNNISTN
jgi:hypothetical protein